MPIHEIACRIRTNDDPNRDETIEFTGVYIQCDEIHEDGACGLYTKNCYVCHEEAEKHSGCVWLKKAKKYCCPVSVVSRWGKEELAKNRSFFHLWSRQPPAPGSLVVEVGQLRLPVAEAHGPPPGPPPGLSRQDIQMAHGALKQINSKLECIEEKMKNLEGGAEDVTNMKTLVLEVTVSVSEVKSHVQQTFSDFVILTEKMQADSEKMQAAIAKLQAALRRHGMLSSSSEDKTPKSEASPKARGAAPAEEGTEGSEGPDAKDAEEGTEPRDVADEGCEEERAASAICTIKSPAP